MHLQELMSRIHLPKEAQETAFQYLLEDEIYENWKKLFYTKEKAFLEAWERSSKRLQRALSFYLRLTCEVYAQYRQQKIPDEIFDATFSDITIWCKECRRKYGVYGLAEVPWIGLSVKMKLFRLGRLQFEPEGELLNVHIPAGEKLDYEECVKSFRRADDFFGDAYKGYACDSWLLSPTLKELLPEESNIIKFQNLFEITSVHHSFPQAEQRIFQDIRKDKENYPEQTLLQKKAKEYILSGKDIGIGVGVLYRQTYTAKASGKDGSAKNCAAKASPL